MTQISPGCTYMGPNSVRISSAPCWGTMRKSPSEFTAALLFMLALQRYVCTARPSRRVGSPEPAIVLRPEMKSTSPSLGMSKGSQASCVGETWTRLFAGRKLDSVSSLSGKSVCEHVSACVICHRNLVLMRIPSRPRLCGGVFGARSRNGPNMT
jgi:hypothetical protein